MSAIVKFVKYDVSDLDRLGFDAFMREFAAYVRDSSECLFYEHLVDTSDATVAFMFSAWPDDSALKQHEEDPRHLDMLAVVSDRWGVQNLRVNTWSHAGGYAAKVIASPEQLAAGRLK